MNASSRTSRTTWYAILLLQVFISHCTAAVMTMMTAISFSIAQIPSKSTAPGPRMQSTACPVRIGIYKVSTTETAASTMEKSRKNLYFPM